MSAHAGHHRHLIGARIVCSCGEYLGLVCTDHQPHIADVCQICRGHGVLAHPGDVVSAFRLPEPERSAPMPLLSAEEAAAQS